MNDKIKTMGRWPTKSELIEYYSRDDIAAVIYCQSKRWKILMQFGEDYLLEPTSEKDTRDKIVQQLNLCAQDITETDRFPPNRYPTMHLLKDRGEAAISRYDFMAEGDPRSWTAAFADMTKAIDVLDTLNVFYRIKFSGRRSLHLIIPAESLPETFRGKPTDMLFGEINRRIMEYLPFSERAESTAGLRVVYSTHARGGMVSIPLRRQELPNFKPWMANIYTVVVDWDWFEVPDDAVERNEAFLHTVFNSTKKADIVPPPKFQPSSIKAYKEIPPPSESEILRGIASDQPNEQIAALRAALAQNVKLPHEKLSPFLRSADQDSRWFAWEIALRDTSKTEVEDILRLFEGITWLRDHWDEYLYDLGTRYLQAFVSSTRISQLCDYFTVQGTINRNTVMVARAIRELDEERFASLLAHIHAESLGAWFEKVWVVCGSVLCTGDRRGIGPIFERAAIHAKMFDVDAAEIGDKLRQLSLLRDLRNSRPIRKVKDAPLFKAADELTRDGRDLKGLVREMLGSDNESTAAGAVRLLMHLEWDDTIDLLIQQLEVGSLAAKSAQKALVEIGEPAVDRLIELTETSPHRWLVTQAIEVLGEIRQPADTIVSALMPLLRHDDRFVRGAAAEALGDIGEPADMIVAALTQALNDTQGNYKAASALGRIGNAAKTAVPALIDTLTDNAACQHAIYALGRIGADARAAVPALKNALTHPTDSIRREAATALGQIGEAAKDAIPELTTALQSESKSVRRDASWALRQIAQS